MKSPTHAKVVPMFLTKDSSESIIPNEDDGYCKFNNVLKLKCHAAIEPKTKSRVERRRRHKLNKSSTRLAQYYLLQASYRRNAFSHISIDSRSNSKSSSMSIPHYQNLVCKGNKIIQFNIKARKQFLGMIDNFKVCETFLSFLSLSDLLNFNYLFKRRICSSSYSFLVKKQTELSLSAARYANERKALWEAITRLNSVFCIASNNKYAFI